MKIKDGFVLQEMAGHTAVIPGGGGLALITLDDIGAFLWRQMEQETDEVTLIAALLAEYDVEEKTARTRVKALVGKLYQHGFLE